MPVAAPAIARLAPERVSRRYRGGALLGALRGMVAKDTLTPEDWVGSDTLAKDGGVTGEEGLARLAGGELVRDALAADPEWWLGAAHVAAHGPRLGVLVKLLDPAERLPVHAHPSAAFAREHLGARHGKSEAWRIVRTRDDAPGRVWLGMREDVDPAELLAWVAAQNTTALLGALNEVEVAPGDTFWVPGGLPHAIGGGMLLVEVQEPTDWSIHLEQAGYATRARDEHALGIGWEGAVRALDLSAHTPTRGLPPAARELFGIDDAIQPGVCNIVIVLDGEGDVGGEPARAGDTFIVAAAAADSVGASGTLQIAACTPHAHS